jgi:uncharacterized protein (TIGR02217 family)
MISNARASQVAIEELATASSNARSSQVVLEELSSAVTVSNARASQAVLEILVKDSNARASQVVLEELLVQYYLIDPPPVFPTLPWGLPVIVTPSMASVKGRISSGRDMRAPQQQLPIWQFEINFETLRDQTQNATLGSLAGFTDFMKLSQLFIASIGQFGQFLFDAWWDDSRADQPIGTGDGGTTSFTIVRTWGYGGLQFTEPVGWVNVMTSVQVAGVTQSPSTYSVSGSNTLIFTLAPASGAAITATFSFYYLCQFAEDQHDYSEFYKDRWTVKIKFRSVLSEQTSPPLSFASGWPPSG